MADDSRKLLVASSMPRSDEAIRALVERHSAVVYGTALRRLNGDRAAAQDVTQEVFLLLLRKMAGLQGVLLSGWLYRQACRRAANHVRSEQRRKSRERAAADAMEPAISGADPSPFLSRELDDALLSLPATDRDAIVLRFFEGKDYRGVGLAMNITEEAARKRVKRALDRLGATLKKNGTAVGGGSLEVVLLGAECGPVPEPFATALSAKVVKAGAGAGGGTTVLAIFKPLLAGAIAASLVAGSAVLVIQSPPAGIGGTPGAVALGSVERRPRFVEELPDASSLEGIIAEVQRARSGPENTLTKLRIEVILGRIPDQRIPEFIAIADTKMAVVDQVAIYDLLLKRWAKSEPEAALGFIVRENAGERIDVASSTNLLNNVFTDWSWKDRHASAAWLVANWEEPALEKKGFVTDLRGFLAMEIADQIYRNDGVEPLFKFIETLPASRRIDILGVVAGDSNWHSTAENGPASRLLEFSRALQALPDQTAVAALTTRFWTNVVSRTTALEELRASLTPQERFQVALGAVNVRSRLKDTTKMAGGGLLTSFELVKDHAEREAAAIKAGEQAGFSRGEIMAAMGRTMLVGGDERRIAQWYSSNGGGPEFDEAFAALARRAAAMNGWSGDRLPEMVAIEWASKVADPELRLSLARGAFLRLIARNADAAATFPDRPGMPADVASELKSLLVEAP